MNERLIFKAWDNRQKCFWNSEDYTSLGNFFNDLTDGKGNINFERYTLIQFTGLYDKNNNKIYEGDIIINEDNNKQIVIFSIADGKYLLDNQKGDYYNLNETEVKNIEIIGNKHSHPDLFKKISGGNNEE